MNSFDFTLQAVLVGSRALSQAREMQLLLPAIDFAEQRAHDSLEELVRTGLKLTKSKRTKRRS